MYSFCIKDTISSSVLLIRPDGGAIFLLCLNTEMCASAWAKSWRPQGVNSNNVYLGELAVSLLLKRAPHP